MHFMIKFHDIKAAREIENWKRKKVSSKTIQSPFNMNLQDNISKVDCFSFSISEKKTPNDIDKKPKAKITN